MSIAYSLKRFDSDTPSQDGCAGPMIIHNYNKSIVSGQSDRYISHGRQETAFNSVCVGSTRRPDLIDLGQFALQETMINAFVPRFLCTLSGLMGGPVRRGFRFR